MQKGINMLGFDLLTAGTLLTLAAAQPQSSALSAQENPCPLVKTTQINVKPATEDVHYDSSKTLAQLQGTHIDTINPYDFSGVTSLQGFMKGNIAIKQNIRIGRQFQPALGAYCLWYDTIGVDIQISPTIVIAKEVYNDPCLRPVTIEHELRHVNVDRQIVNKYAKIIGQKIYAALQERGFRAHPVPEEYVQSMNERMGTVVAQVIKLENDKMQLERLETQRAVDSWQEYERMSKLCPASRDKLPAWPSSSGHASSGGNR